MSERTVADVIQEWRESQPEEWGQDWGQLESALNYLIATQTDGWKRAATAPQPAPPASAEYHRGAKEAFQRVADEWPNSREKAQAWANNCAVYEQQHRDAAQPQPASTGAPRFVLKCGVCGHETGEGEYISIAGCSKCNPVKFYNSGASTGEGGTALGELEELVRLMKSESSPKLWGYNTILRYCKKRIEALRYSSCPVGALSEAALLQDLKIIRLALLQNDKNDALDNIEIMIKRLRPVAAPSETREREK
jgi:hypothetical protein